MLPYIYIYEINAIRVSCVEGEEIFPWDFALIA